MTYAERWALSHRMPLLGYAPGPIPAHYWRDAVMGGCLVAALDWTHDHWRWLHDRWFDRIVRTGRWV